MPIHFHSFADFFPPLYIYLKVALIALFGFTALNLRLLSSLAGIASIPVMYFVAKKMGKNPMIGILAAFFLAISPWHIQFSRIGFSVTLMLLFFLLGVYFFFKGFKNPAWFAVACIGFGLSAWSYATAELFVPLFILGLVVLYYNELWGVQRKYLYTSLSILVILFGIILFSSFFGNGNMRLGQISIFDDPVMSSTVQYNRQQQAISGGETGVGLKTTLAQSLTYNKPLYVLDMFWKNYVSAFSTNFLFIKGDPNIRQSPPDVGEFYRIDMIAMVLGLIVLILSLSKKEGFVIDRKISALIIYWMLISPLPAALTRDGAFHATRLFFLLPVLILLMGIGIYYGWIVLFKKNIFVVGIYTLIVVFEIFIFYQNFFTIYRFQSAPNFEYGFNQAIRAGNRLKGGYDGVVYDSNKDSLLMAYLFVNKYPPADFQKILPNLHVNLTHDIVANKIGKTYLINHGGGTIWDLVTQRALKGHFLLFVSAENILQPQEEGFKSLIAKTNPPQLKLLGTINYPDNRADFYIVDYENNPIHP